MWVSWLIYVYLGWSTGCLKKKLSFVEISCGKYITAVTPPFKIVLALIYPRHSTGDPEHPTGGIGGAHGRGGGVGVDHQGGHQDVQGLGQGEEFRVETVVSDDYIVLGGCWGNDWCCLVGEGHVSEQGEWLGGAQGEGQGHHGGHQGSNCPFYSLKSLFMTTLMTLSATMGTSNFSYGMSRTPWTMSWVYQCQNNWKRWSNNSNVFATADFHKTQFFLGTLYVLQYKSSYTI